MSDLVRRLSIPNEIAVFMWKPFLLPGENQRDYENASPNDDRRHPAKAALKEAKSSADSVISNGGLENILNSLLSDGRDIIYSVLRVGECRASIDLVIGGSQGDAPPGSGEKGTGPTGSSAPRPQV